MRRPARPDLLLAAAVLAAVAGGAGLLSQVGPAAPAMDTPPTLLPAASVGPETGSPTPRPTAAVPAPPPVGQGNPGIWATPAEFAPPD